MDFAVQKIGIVGAGQMGRGIAQVAAQSGYTTFLYDMSTEGLAFALGFIEKQLQRGVEKGKWSAAEASLAQSRLTPAKSLEEVAAVDLVIEAASEKWSVKEELFRELDQLAPTQTILATNTSSISITQLAAVTERPTQVAGMHFMNPVPVMKLVEGIRGLETAPAVFQTVQHVAETMGKTFVKANDRPGFAVNRILMPMINEAIYALYENVAEAKDLDLAMKLGTNQPMGPLELADFIGLDTCLAIMNVLHDGLGDTKYRACPLLKQYVAAGRFGRKSKQGFYSYE